MTAVATPTTNSTPPATGSTSTTTTAVGVDRPSIIARALMLPIRAWRLVSQHLPARCRFHPSCSQYALDALTVHGAARGSWLAIRRVGRCHPWHDGGLDPVPPKSLANTRSTHAVLPPTAEES